MEEVSQEQIALLSSVIDKLVIMLRAARDGFNRHSRARLEELKDLRELVFASISAASRQIETEVPKIRKTEAERAALLRFHSILSHLGIIGDTIGSLAEPLQKKIQGGILFSDKAVSQSNHLFNQQERMLRSLLDIIKTDNEFLKKYVLDEGHTLIQQCFDFATEHEERLIEGLCLPQVAPVFLAMLDRMRLILRHIREIAKLLAKQG